MMACTSELISGTDSYHPNDVVVAVIGTTGTGKLSFVRLVTGNDDIKVGERLHSGKLLYSKSLSDKDY